MISDATVSSENYTFRKLEINGAAVGFLQAPTVNLLTALSFPKHWFEYVTPSQPIGEQKNRYMIRINNNSVGWVCRTLDTNI